MKYQTARNLTMLDIDSMTLKQVQRHKVRLLDVRRDSRVQYGFDQAVKDGFYRVIADSVAQGFVPRDMWLTDRINHCLDQATAREAYLLSLPEY